MSQTISRKPHSDDPSGMQLFSTRGGVASGVNVIYSSEKERTTNNNYKLSTTLKSVVSKKKTKLKETVKE